MKLRQSLALFLLLFAGIVSAHAQVGSAIVTAAANFSVSASDAVTIKAQIVSCGTGQLPLYNGVPISLTPNQTPLAPFTATNTGSAQSVTFTVPGNDKVMCGSQAYSLYAITWYDNGFPLAPTGTYRFIDATSQTLANLVPISFTPPVLNSTAGAICPSTAPVLAGFDSHYNPVCGTASSGTFPALPVAGGTMAGNINFANQFGLNNLAFINGTQYAGVSVAAAFAAAGSTGSIIIPPTYAGTDTFSSNPNGLRFHDLRPLGSPFTAVTVVNAADYGATCKGIGQSNDTAAIQAALKAPYVYNQPTASIQYVDVQLPQGTCVINAPLQLGVHGALTGQGDATFLAGDYSSWVGTDYTMIEISTNGAMPGGASVGARQISNFNIIGLSNATIASATGILIINNANVYDPSGHTFPNLSFHDLQISGFDTGIRAEDMVNSEMHNVNINTVRAGILFTGDVVNVFLNHLNVESGSWNATSNHTTTFGLQIIANNKYNPTGCAAHTTYCAPQGIFIDDSSVFGFDTEVELGQCVQCTFHHNTFDLGGGGAGGSGPAFQIDLLGLSAYGTYIDSNMIGTTKGSNGFGISSTAIDNGAGGLFITNNTFLLDTGNTPSGAGAFGIVLSGSAAISNVHIDGNNFHNLTEGIVLQQPIHYSTIGKNSGNSIITQLIDLSGVASLAHTGLYLDGNSDLDGVPVLNIGTATGFHLGWNISPAQLTGTQTVATAGCAITAGAIGNSCNNTITFSTSGGQAMFNTSYRTVCSASGGSGLWTVGNPNTPTTTSVIVPSVALTTSATGGGFVTCTITSVQ